MEIEDFERRSDPSDAASDLEARIIQDGIKQALSITGPEPTGFCLNPKCETPVERPKKFCNGECAAEHAAIEKLKARR